MVEKPEPEKAPSTLSIIGRYILQPEVFDHLGRDRPRRRRRDPAHRRARRADRQRQAALRRLALRGEALRLRRQGRVPAGQYRFRARPPRHERGGADAFSPNTADRRSPSQDDRMRDDGAARAIASTRPSCANTTFAASSARRCTRPTRAPSAAASRAWCSEARRQERRGRPRRPAELARARGGAGRGAGRIRASMSCASGSVRRRCSISPSTRWASMAGSW